MAWLMIDLQIPKGVNPAIACINRVTLRRPTRENSCGSRTWRRIACQLNLAAVTDLRETTLFSGFAS